MCVLLYVLDYIILLPNYSAFKNNIDTRLNGNVKSLTVHLNYTTVKNRHSIVFQNPCGFPFFEPQLAGSIFAPINEKDFLTYSVLILGSLKINSLFLVPFS